MANRVKSGKIRKSGKFGHTFANSGNPGETGLIRIFTVCFVNLFFILIIEQTRRLSEFCCLS